MGPGGRPLPRERRSIAPRPAVLGGPAPRQPFLRGYRLNATTINGRRYRAPAGKTAVICLDGVDPAYLEDAFERRLLPRLAELADAGSYLRGRSQLPSFTNPNNLSIVTGAPPSVHGLPGNHYLAPGGDEIQLDRPELLRAPSIHAVLGGAGVRVLAVTTKEKLRALLGAGGVPCVSAEWADLQTLEGLDGMASKLVGRPKPGIYDWDCSHYALELGLALGARLEIELLYVSLTDAVQHAAAPGEELSDRYLARLDELIGAYLDAGWRLALVADHGMNAKTLPTAASRTFAIWQTSSRVPGSRARGSCFRSPIPMSPTTQRSARPAGCT